MTLTLKLFGVILSFLWKWNVEFNDKGFIKIKSERYGDTIILCKFDWVARQAVRKGHLAYTVQELEEFLAMTRGEQDLWHETKKIFRGDYVGTF